VSSKGGAATAGASSPATPMTACSARLERHDPEVPAGSHFGLGSTMR
jgi:hypothetical protein